MATLFDWLCVTAFDELHDYFRTVMCSHGYFV